MYLAQYEAYIQPVPPWKQLYNPHIKQSELIKIIFHIASPQLCFRILQLAADLWNLFWNL